MNIPYRHHTWLVVAIFIVVLSACTTPNSSPTIPSPTTSNQPPPSPTTSNQPTPSPTTPNQPTPSSTTPNQSAPTQTLDVFCTAMKVHNQIGPNLAAAGLQFTDQGWKQFQPPGQKEKGIPIVQMTRSRYSPIRPPKVI